MKHCKKCGQEKPLSCFYKHPKMGDGYLNFCKECVKERVASHRTKNAERIREYDRERAKTPHRRNEMLRRCAIFRAKNPDKYKAHLGVSNALKCGRVVRQPCELCGEVKSVAHHGDYSRPLAVVWLCYVCHAAVHNQRVIVRPF